jgi:hypothetical protein
MKMLVIYQCWHVRYGVMLGYVMTTARYLDEVAQWHNHDVMTTARYLDEVAQWHNNESYWLVPGTFNID